ncbi:GNAT family N-acetyltransferase [Actinomycetota bacterium Odt1-20B]
MSVVIRPLSGPEEVGLFNQLPYTLNHEIAEDLAGGRRRPEWMWVALRGDQVLARIAWWGRAAEDEPLVLDVFDVLDTGPADSTAEGAASLLLDTALEKVVPVREDQVRPEYSRFLPGDWREVAAERRAVERRVGLLEAAGARHSVERLRLQWEPGSPVPEPDGRLLFRPVEETDAGTEELIGLMTRALDGTLDHYSRTELARMTPREAAVEHYEGELARYGTPRSWWRIATLPGGEPVGFVIPARNSYNAIIAYIGIVPEHRGHGYIDPLLAEGTRVLAAEDVPRIRASTDLGNSPMAAAFARAGYVTFEREFKMAWGRP